jgi:hypothetical protein
MFAPLPGTSSPDGIIAFTFEESDDGRQALVEFVARDRAAFEPIIRDTSSSMKVFREGKDRRDDIEREFRRHKRNFRLDQLRVGAL